MNEKPTKKLEKVPVITKFIYTLGVLPTSYLMSMTYEEQLTWLCNYIQKTLIPSINDDIEAIQELQSLYEDLRNYVNNYFDNLDVQEEINNKLDSLIEDGTFTNIISNYLKTDIVMDRIFRIVDSYQYQGACQYNNYIVSIGYSGEYSKANILDIDGNIINSYNLRNNSHANSIAYKQDTNQFYVANGDGTIDIYSEIFEYIETITLNNLYSLCYYNNIMYGITTDKKLYNFSTESYINLNIELNTVPQNFIIDNNTIYILNSNGNNIITCDMQGNLIKIYNLGIGNNIYPYGECESIFKFNDKIYISSMSYFGSAFRENFLSQYWITNINNQIAIENIPSVANYNYYVSNQASNNPRGSENSPFNYLSELALVMDYRKAINPQIIINDFIGSNLLAGTINGTINNNSGKEIKLLLYNSDITLRNNSTATNLYSGNIYYSNIKTSSYCNLSASVENCDLLLGDAATFTGTARYSKINILNNRSHDFSATSCGFNTLTFQDVTSPSNIMKSILSMPFVRPYNITFMMSGNTYDSLSVQINSSRHSSINSENGLTIPTSRGNIIMKNNLITQDSGVYCYGISISR